MHIKMLLIDDQPMILASLKGAFESRGFEVSTASSAREAVAALSTERFELIVTDVRMEKSSSGFEVIRAAKAQSYDPVVAIVTAFPIPAAEWRSAGADALFMKADTTRNMPETLLKLVNDRRARQSRQ